MKFAKFNGGSKTPLIEFEGDTIAVDGDTITIWEVNAAGTNVIVAVTNLAKGQTVKMMPPTPGKALREFYGKMERSRRSDPNRAIRASRADMATLSGDRESSGRSRVLH